MSQNRETTETILVLYRAIEAFKSDSMTEADRQLIQLLLSGIAKDWDVREYFWKPVKHRPRGDEDGRRYNAAFVYHGRIRTGEASPGKVLAGQIADLSGMTDSQVEHAQRDYGYHVGAFMDILTPDELNQHIALRVETFELRRSEK